MAKREPPIIQSPLPRPSRWPYWVVVPLCAMAYTGFCFAVMVLAWGVDGVSPWWYGIAHGLALPGMLLTQYIGFIGAPLWGGLMGFGITRLTRQMWSRRRSSLPPHG